MPKNSFISFYLNFNSVKVFVTKLWDDILSLIVRADGLYLRFSHKLFDSRNFLNPTYFRNTAIMNKAAEIPSVAKIAGTMLYQDLHFMCRKFFSAML